MTHPHTDPHADPRPTGNGPTLTLTAVSAGLGVIGVAIGFATVLGTAATAAGDGGGGGGYGPLVMTAASALVLGVILCVGAVLLWRANRAARPVIGLGLALLAVSTVVRMSVDAITFMSVIGSVLSLCTIVGMGALLASGGVRSHVRAGVPIRLH